MADYQGERVYRTANGSAAGLIIAAAEYAEGKQGVTPPPELVDWLRCQRFNALPFAGGWKDQPHKFIERAVVLSNVYMAHKAYRDALKTLKSENLVKWKKDNPDVMKVIREVNKITNAIS